MKRGGETFQFYALFGTRLSGGHERVPVLEIFELKILLFTFQLILSNIACVHIFPIISVVGIQKSNEDIYNH